MNTNRISIGAPSPVRRLLLAMVATVALGAALAVVGVVIPPATRASASPAPLITRQVLQNPSFESGFAPWTVTPGQNFAVYAASPASQAVEDGHYLETNTGTAGVGAALRQTTGVHPTQGASYRSEASLRSPSGRPIRYQLSVAVVDAAGTLQSGVSTGTVQSTGWIPIFADVDVTASHGTGLAFSLRILTAGTNLDVDGASLGEAGLDNPSFEQGVAHWSFTSGQNFAVYANGAQENDHYLETNTGNASPGATLRQGLAAGVTDGTSYRAQIFARSPTGARVSGKLMLTAAGGSSPSQSKASGFTVWGTAWHRISVDLDISNATFQSLTVGVQLLTAQRNLDLDAASLANAGLMNPSFEEGGSSWSATAGANAMVYGTGVPSENSHFLETNLGRAAPGGGIAQTVTAPIVAGRGYRALVSLRSPRSAHIDVHVTLSAVGGTVAPQSTSTELSIWRDGWVIVPVELDVAGSGHTGLTLSIGLFTAGPNLDIDQAGVVLGTMAWIQHPSLPPPPKKPPPPPPPPPPSPSLGQQAASLALSQDQNGARVVEHPTDSNCNLYTAFFGRGSTVGDGGRRCDPGKRSEEWCSDFAEWAWAKVGVGSQWSGGLNGITGYSYSFVDWGIDHGTFKVGATNDPAVGDAVVWGNTSSGIGQHVGIVSGVSGGLIQVVSGNSGPLDAAGNNIAVYVSGYFNPSTSFIDGFPIVGYVSPTPLTSNSARVASPLLVPGTRTTGPSYSGISRGPALSGASLAGRIAAQDDGR